MLLVYLICEINKIELNWIELCVCVLEGGGVNCPGGNYLGGNCPRPSLGFLKRFFTWIHCSKLAKLIKTSLPVRFFNNPAYDIISTVPIT